MDTPGVPACRVSLEIVGAAVPETVVQLLPSAPSARLKSSETIVAALAACCIIGDASAQMRRIGKSAAMPARLRVPRKYFPAIFFLREISARGGCAVRCGKMAVKSVA
jgi:hypothetical protein